MSKLQGCLEPSDQEKPKLYVGRPDDFYADRDSSSDDKSVPQKRVYTVSDTGTSVGQGVINYDGMAEQSESSSDPEDFDYAI